MSRFCMYCGRELAKEEKCNCAASVAARRRTQNAGHSGNADGNADNANVGNNAQNFKKEKKQKQKREWKRPNFSSAKKVNRYNDGSFFRNFAHLIKNFFKNPVYTVTNPGAAGKAESIVIVGILGVVVSLVFFFSTSNVNRGIFSILSRIIGFKGTKGFAQIGGMILNMLAFTAFSYIQFFALSGIFYLIQRYVLRLYTRFWDIAVCIAISTVPIAAVGIIGILVSFFSMHTVITMLCAAAVVTVVLMYEAIKQLWQPLSPDRLIYVMAIGCFVYFGICGNLFAALLNA